ncbi:C2-DOMAIN ABA-RELATED 7 [Olea europaea subsp. europaea]|uniref:C2-DOMAIN ABA-RELATED 7 n=1 Tax=Olea europaea subsp. europaea TaxID=158383 RepID=A0A8S0T4W8_OLEEU|nr:C2-DOMAIN ABA-RELATED 7 [Olea europaea subsp. europaea]
MLYLLLQKVKTRVVKDNCNPLWDEELTISIKNPNEPIVLDVYDKDTFTRDDSMGNAEIDIKPCIECLRMELQGLPDGTKVDRIQPSRNNCLADESCIIWNKGKMTQDMVLRLRNVESGEVEVQIEWIDLPGLKGIQG